MNIERNIRILNHKECISVAYTKKEHEKTDSSVAIYDKYKLSILLTDGLAAIVNGNVIDSGKNSILFFRPDEIHFGRFFRSGLHEYLDFYIPVTFFESFCGSITAFFEDISDDRVNYIMLDSSHQKTVSEIARKTIDIISSDDAISNIKIFTFMLQILLLCSDFYEAQKRSPMKTQIPKFVTQTMLYISEHFDEKILLDNLAVTAGCSVTYLSLIFKRYTGQTIYNHIIATRISNAQIMLKGGASVTEACFSSGFDDCSNFIRTFKKLTGKTPLKYKMS